MAEKEIAVDKITGEKIIKVMVEGKNIQKKQLKRGIASNTRTIKMENVIVEEKYLSSKA